MKRKIKKEFVDHGYGFPVILRNVPMIHVRGVWTPDVNYNKVRDAVLHALAFKPARLAGNEIRFIRQASEMTVEAFANRFVVTHPAVLKWEKCRHKATPMNWATEKDIRMFILVRLGVNPKKVVVLYHELVAVKSPKPSVIKIDVETRKAA